MVGARSTFLQQSGGASRKASLRKMHLPLIPRDKRTNQPKQKAEESARRVPAGMAVTRNRRKLPISCNNSSSSRFVRFCDYILMWCCNC